MEYLLYKHFVHTTCKHRSGLTRNVMINGSIYYVLLVADRYCVFTLWGRCTLSDTYKAPFQMDAKGMYPIQIHGNLITIIEIPSKLEYLGKLKFIWTIITTIDPFINTPRGSCCIFFRILKKRTHFIKK